MFNGKMKAFTLSFDDGVTQDIRLIHLLEKYHLPCTFNINSGKLGRSSFVYNRDTLQRASHNRIPVQWLSNVYDRYEVAVHTVHHPSLPKLSDEEIIWEVNRDAEFLSERMHEEVIGMAYPNGDYDDRVVRLLAEHTPIKYSRTIHSTLSFDLQTEDLLRFHPSVHHSHWEDTDRLTEEFINLKPDSPKLFYVWGHSYEMDMYDEWDKLEAFFEKISNRDDIFYGTNKEVLLG